MASDEIFFISVKMGALTCLIAAQSRFYVLIMISIYSHWSEILDGVFQYFIMKVTSQRVCTRNENDCHL